jgi:hypothetical protein
MNSSASAALGLSVLKGDLSFISLRVAPITEVTVPGLSFPGIAWIGPVFGQIASEVIANGVYGVGATTKSPPSFFLLLSWLETRPSVLHPALNYANI